MEISTLGPVNNFTIQRGEFAQILHTGSSHWVLASNIGWSSPSEVRLYDSLFRGRVQLAVKQQIASIIHEEGKSFKIVVPKVQRQNNYHDCGIFTIGFLVSLLHGLNPSDLTFDNEDMRKHLIKSLKGAFFHPFPLSQVQEQRTQVFFQNVPVICDCRMLWDKSAGKSPSPWNASLPFLTWSLKVQMPLGGARSVRRLSRKRKTNDHRFNEESITQRKNRLKAEAQLFKARYTCS